MMTLVSWYTISTFSHRRSNQHLCKLIEDMMRLCEKLLKVCSKPVEACSGETNDNGQGVPWTSKTEQ